MLKFAKEGVYSSKSLVDLPKEYLNKYFKQIDDGNFKVSDELKARLSFKKHNLLEDAYFNDVNMIVCRNVVIYFTDEAKDDVYKKFNRSLKKDGILFIGSTEQILKSKDLGFEVLKTFFYKKM